MSELLDRIEAALADSVGGSFREQARIVLMTIREPSQGMLDSTRSHPATHAVNGLIVFANAHGARLTDEFRGLNSPLAQWWRAIIDDGLKE